MFNGFGYFWRNFMSRWSYSSRDKVEDCKKLEISWLKKIDYLVGYRGGNISWSIGERKTGNIGIYIVTLDDEENYIRFQYAITNNSTGEKKDFDYKIPLITTKCNYGKKRYWFKCQLSINGQYCGRRVGALYLPPNAQYFGCRHCHNLTYETRNKNRKYKLFPLFYFMEKQMEAEKLEEKIKRKYYKGQPTKKQKRINRIYEKLLPYLPKIKGMR